MLESKRNFKRFDLPLIVKFKPTHGKVQYSLGLLKNISCEGLGIEAREFNFIQHENLELELKLPHNKASVSLLGDVMWKKREGNVSYAGIRFRLQNKETQNELLEKISKNTNIPIESFFSKDIYPKEKEILPGKGAQKNKARQKPQRTSLLKQYSNGGSRCNVTFILPREAAVDAATVTVAGDFNNWDPASSLMSRLKNGDFSLSLDLDGNREYRFKYLIDGDRWENDWHADKYVPNAFGSDDSVVIT